MNDISTMNFVLTYAGTLGVTLLIFLGQAVMFTSPPRLPAVLAAIRDHSPGYGTRRRAGTVSGPENPAASRLWPTPIRS